MAGIAALASAGMGIAGSLFGKDTASQVQLPPQFQMPGMGQAAQGVLSGIQNLPYTQAGAQTQPLAWQSAMNLYNNPGAGALLQGAQGAQGLGQMAALGQYGMGGGLAGYGAGLLPYSQNLLQMGFDPRQELYNRTAGQLQQQTLANLANAGLGTSPYGQGVLGNTMGNFNIDWQNQQLARALQGAQGAGGILGAGGGAITQGSGLQSGAAGQYGSFAGLPYAAYGTIGAGQLGALGDYQNVGKGGQQLAMSPIDAYQRYLTGGIAQQGANQQGAGLALDQAGLAFKQNQILGSNLGAGIYGLGQGYSKMGSPFGSLFGSKPSGGGFAGY